MLFAKQYLKESIDIINLIDTEMIEKMASAIFDVKHSNGRLFFLGIGGSAGNASHAVNDFRKILNINDVNNYLSRP